MKNRQIVLWVCLGISLVSLLAGCMTMPKETMIQSATDYNLMVERAQNEMLLLNIVRASKRRPMYFTTSSKLSGTLELGYETGSLSIPFGKIGTGLNGAYSIAPKVSFSSKPTIDIAVLNAKEFATALMQPLPLETMLDFWQRGWHKEILLHLFVQRIKTDEGKYYENHPEDKEADFKEFQSKLREIADNCDLDFEKIPGSPIGPPLPECEVRDLTALVEAHKAGLTLVGSGQGVPKIYQLTSPEKNEPSFKCKKIARRKECQEGKKDEEQQEFSVLVHGRNAKKTDSAPKAEAEKKGTEYTIYLRTPEAILYYLGEIMRAEANIGKTEKDFIPQVVMNRCPAKEKVPLFVARKVLDLEKSAYLTVDYEGTKYGIAKISDSDKPCEADRSMYVLELISLLIMKQTSAGELPPSTGTVITK